MLVTPVEYLQDLGEIWTQWGGQWGGNGDPVHFQLRGAPSAELLEQLAGKRPIGLSVGDWILQKYNALPWWLSLILPPGMTVNSATNPATQKIIDNAARELGL
jgi:hypothetical protein